MTRLAAGGPAPSGLVLLRKPEGITSFQALTPVKRALSSGRVGHAGTLDRFARGLLIVLTGSSSRLSSYVMGGEKLYLGVVAFGSETDTLDPEGEIVAEAPPPSRAALEEALSRFRGPIMQTPPAYSAVHIGGRRAYEIALGGETPALVERRVEIFSLELLSYEGDKALIEVRCSSGTYIRSLARDLALACGSRAHLVSLERLSIGPYLLRDAVEPSAFDPKTDLRAFSRGDASALGLRCLVLEEGALVARFAQGGKIAPASFKVADGGAEPLGSDSAVFDASGLLLGIIRVESEGIKYKAVMPSRGEA